MIDHLRAIKSGAVTKSNVIGIRKALNALDRKRSGFSISCTAPKLSFEELDTIMAELARVKPVVIGELDKSGLKLLRSPRYRKRLERVAHIVATNPTFQLVDFEEFARGKFVPVYRAVSERDGAAFTFRHIPWQSGGTGPEILSVNGEPV